MGGDMNRCSQNLLQWLGEQIMKNKGEVNRVYYQETQQEREVKRRSLKPTTMPK